MRKSLIALVMTSTFAVAGVVTSATADARRDWWSPALVYGYEPYYGYRYPAYYRPYARRVSGLIHESGHQPALVGPTAANASWRRPASVYGYEAYYGYRHPAYYRPRRGHEYDHHYGLHHYGSRLYCRYRDWRYC
jgi:hypothetical protein